MSLTLMLDTLFFGLSRWERGAIIMAVLLALASIAYFRYYLDLLGTAAAVVIGFIVFFSGGISGFAIFLFFFLSSSIITKVCGNEERKKRRGISSVLANGLPAAISLIFYSLTANQMFLVAFTAAVAEATSDTWAGEIGQLSHRDPVSIVTFTRVQKGISGGVTVLGLVASLIASLMIAVLFAGTFGSTFRIAAAITASGFTGALFDSFLGATVQAQYRRKDGTITEDADEGIRVRGIPFIDNDAVNFLSGLFAMSIAIAVYLI